MRLEELRHKFERDGALVAGVLSGTSADGIDVALTRIRVRAGRIERPEVLSFSIEPFPPDVRPRVRALLDGAPVTLAELARLDRDLGRAFGRAAREVAARAGVAPDLVASHGQTVWHHDGREPTGPATLQIGDGDFVAEEAGAAVASDFRLRDVAAGGEGAPVSALADPILFAQAPRPCCVLNLGGMANLTVLGRTERDVLAFDTGPANALLDGLAQRLLGTPCDRDGAAAAAGRSAPDFVEALLAQPFFSQPPPKSTGRDTFGAAWVEAFLARARGTGLHSPADLLATATHLVARSVALAIERFLPEAPRELFLAGGGVHNRTLVQALAAETGVPVASTRECGIDPDAREALVFAVLGAALALELPLSHPGATGARAGRVLGKFSPAVAPA